MAEKFARNLFSERDYSQQAAIQSLRSAFLLGIKQEVEIEDGDIWMKTEFSDETDW